MSNLYSVAIINALVHSEETKKILDWYVKKRLASWYIRDSILLFATKKGFKPVLIKKLIKEKKPKYIKSNIWQAITKAHEKSYHVDFGYAIAFFWLLSLPEFEKYNKSKLMREIILSRQ